MPDRIPAPTSGNHIPSVRMAKATVSRIYNLVKRNVSRPRHIQAGEYDSLITYETGCYVSVEHDLSLIEADRKIRDTGCPCGNNLHAMRNTPGSKCHGQT
ncbi:hypothetical protein FRC10_002148, partial [Ceratobasidium sp. 414]